LLDDEIKKNDRSNFEKDKRKILNALRSGKCFTANYYNSDPKGFRFFAENNGKNFSMGELIKLEKGKKIILRTLVPKECDIKLICNGSKVAEKNGMEATWDVTATGAYRVECWLNNRGWIFSNHIRVINEG
jgi:hypothetical protein